MATAVRSRIFPFAKQVLMRDASREHAALRIGSRRSAEQPLPDDGTRLFDLDHDDDGAALRAFLETEPHGCRNFAVRTAATPRCGSVLRRARSPAQIEVIADEIAGSAQVARAGDLLNDERLLGGVCISSAQSREERAMATALRRQRDEFDGFEVVMAGRPEMYQLVERARDVHESGHPSRAAICQNW